ncbi:MAG: toxin-antitoxin system protein [Lachnospiraceae bacterium]|nr:toxin-antitoxin system protein [Lachnospiraceae bacterium]
MDHNSIDITTFDGYILRIDCSKTAEGLKTTAWTDYVLNTMAIDNPLEYAKLYLNNEMQIFIDTED